MRRREFIALLGSAAASWPLAAHAQQPGKTSRIGYLGSGSADLNAEFWRAFRQGLKEVGYIEGQNLAIEYRWAEQNDQLPLLATDLVGRSLAVIVAAGTPQVLALRAATSTIPIVFLIPATQSHLDSSQA
jgi:putative ABC transport system substrate-binding protein